MLTRRSLLFGTSALVLGQLLLGCDSGDAALKIRVLENSLPPQLFKEFQRQVGSLPLSFSQSKQLADLFELLQTWQKPQGDSKQIAIPGFVPLIGNKSVPPSDLVTLGDYWLAAAIQQKLIQPLPLQDIPGWQQLPEVWQQFARRDAQGNISLDPVAQLWAAPYRWGTLMMVYRPDKFQALGWAPADWSDLWRSPLKGHISLPDSARAVIGLTLKKLGQSINLADLESVANLPSELQLLHQQVKFYSSKSYLQPLILEDTWLAVGWSHEILPILKRERELAGVVPQSGSILTADLWVRPTTAPIHNTGTNTGTDDRLSLMKQWIGFCWQPQIATQLSLLSSATSPLFFGKTAVSKTAVPLSENLPESLRQARGTIADAEIQQRSEFLLPLAPKTVEQYRHLWTTMRKATVN